MNILLAKFNPMVGVLGGAEKIFCEMANELALRGHNVSILFSDNNLGKPYFSLKDNIAIYNLNHLQTGGKQYDLQVQEFPVALKLKRELIRLYDKDYAREMKEIYLGNKIADNIIRAVDYIKPDVIISHGLLTTRWMIVDARINIPVVTMFHDEPSDLLSTATNNVIYALSKSTLIHVLLPYGVDIVKKYCPNSSVVVIGNPVAQLSKIIGQEHKDKFKIVTVGRLTKRQKRQDLLIRAFSLIADKFPNWNVEIWGPCTDLKYKDELENIIHKHKLEKRVLLCGSTDNVSRVLDTADIFVLPSQYEGFGLGLVEAMSKGLPVIGMKDCLAISNMIHHGKTGLLSEKSPANLGELLSKLMSDYRLRCALGDAAHEYAKQYSSKVIWENGIQL